MKVVDTFTALVRDAAQRAVLTQSTIDSVQQRALSARIMCGDIREIPLRFDTASPLVVITSPPYGENVSTIPYGQFSFLALHWIPVEDLPAGAKAADFSTTHTLDTASLGGSAVDAQFKSEAMRLVSPSFDAFVRRAETQGTLLRIRRTSAFVYDFFETVGRIASLSSADQHWALTVGNRRVAGIELPFDSICLDIMRFLGGNHVSTLRRDLPVKRMPSRNSEGQMINREAVLVMQLPGSRRPA